MPRPWNPAPALKASIGLHGAAALGTLAMPGAWPWALGALAANHMMLTVAGLLPRSGLLGPNLTRLPAAAAARSEIALTIDDGPDPDVTPLVLDLLDEADARASFFCIGRRARENPGLCREIVARGHRVENHGDAHSWAFSAFGPSRMKADIAVAQATLADITGQAPHFFRPTAGLRNPFLDPVLAALDLQLATWSRRGYDTREGRPDIVLGRLTRSLSAGDILLIHDGHAARTAKNQPVILAILPDLLRALVERELQPVTLVDALA